MDAALQPQENVERPATAAVSNFRRFVLGTLAGLGIGLVAALFIVRQANYDPTPTLTTDRFQAAYERWQATAPADYDIEVRVTGPQAAVYRASVRSGHPQAAWRNGHPLTSRRTFGTWSVPGMFSTIGRDVAALEQAAAKSAQPPLILRAAFDPQHGYPERYCRIDNGSRRGSDAISVTWDVVSFEIVQPETPTSDGVDQNGQQMPETKSPQ